MKRWKNWSFKNKIIGVSVLLLFLSSLFTGALYYSKASRNIISNTTTIMESVMRQVGEQANEEILNLIQQTNAVFGNLTVADAVTNYAAFPDSTAVRIKSESVIADTIAGFRRGNRLIHSVYLSTPYGDFDDYNFIRRHDVKFRESEVFQEISGQEGTYVFWLPAGKNYVFQDTTPVIPVVFRLLLDRKHNVYLLVNLDQKKFTDTISKKFHPDNRVFAVNADGKNVFSMKEDMNPVLEAFGSAGWQESPNVQVKEITLDGNKYLVSAGRLASNGWQIYQMQSEKKLLEDLRALREFIIAVLGGSIVLCIALLYIIIGKLSKPLRELAESMDRVQKQDFTVRFEYESSDEVGRLSDTFNYMVRELENLIFHLNENIQRLTEEKEKVKKIQELKRKEELKALQAQINPHFLYNTLNTITWQAMEQENEDIAVLSQSLGNFFRISLSRGRQIISMEEELKQVESYLKIQKIRYGAKISYEIEVEADCLALPVIKLILQPLVENSIYHGIKLKDGPGNIRIRGRRIRKDRDEILEICVEDDGVGMSAENLEEINRDLRMMRIEDTGGYGIYNINERLRLYYGPDYGLQYESQEGAWTRAVLGMPVNGDRSEIEE